MPGILPIGFGIAKVLLLTASDISLILGRPGVVNRARGALDMIGALMAATVVPKIGRFIRAVRRACRGGARRLVDRAHVAPTAPTPRCYLFDGGRVVWHGRLADPDTDHEHVARLLSH